MILALLNQLRALIMLLLILLVLDLALSLGWPRLGSHLDTFRLWWRLGRWLLVQGPWELFFVVLFVWLLVRRIQFEIIFILLIVLQDQLQDLFSVLICPREDILVVRTHASTLSNTIWATFQVLHLVPCIQIRWAILFFDAHAALILKLALTFDLRVLLYHALIRLLLFFASLFFLLRLFWQIFAFICLRSGVFSSRVLLLDIELPFYWSYRVLHRHVLAR